MIAELEERTNVDWIIIWWKPNWQARIRLEKNISTKPKRILAVT